MAVSDHNFGRGLSNRTYIAADRPDQVPQIVEALRRRDAGWPPALQTIGTINSILDIVPDRQPEKLRVLDDIRALLDDRALDALDDKERDELMALRPPDGLAPIVPTELPPLIEDRLAVKDGRV